MLIYNCFDKVNTGVPRFNILHSPSTLLILTRRSRTSHEVPTRPRVRTKTVRRPASSGVPI
eukprot:1354981-Amorphochlora_amoeboformis.AAC.2